MCNEHLWMCIYCVLMLVVVCSFLCILVGGCVIDMGLYVSWGVKVGG